MKRKIFLSLIIFVLTVMAAAEISVYKSEPVYAAQDASEVGTGETKPAIELTEKTITMYCGDYKTLKLSTGKAYKWSSSNSKIISVTSKGKLFAKKPGTVTITVKDKKGRKATCKVTSRKVVYLTIDDWPNANTEKILDILKENDIKATFFLAGTSNHDSTYKRIADEGHTIGNHTYSHNSKKIYSSYKNLINDIKKQESFIKSVTGKTPVKLFRFPQGSNGYCYKKNGRAFIKKLRSAGYHVFDWSATFGDTSASSTTAKCIANVKKTCKAGCEILLMHNKPQSAAALPSVIKYLKSKGYTFAPITMKTAPWAFIN